MAQAVPHTRFSDVRRFAEVDSTNRVAVDLVRAGAPDGVVVVADHQTAGRGRGGRTWESPPGASLLVSVVLRPAPALVTLAAGVAAAEACEAVTGTPVRLKWPNDLLAVDSRKLGGILSELVDGAAVVGLGVNLAWAPPGAASLGGAVDRDALLEAWLDALDRPGDVLGRYRGRCATLGRRVLVALPGTTVAGVATDVDDLGRLLVDGRAIAAGDVVHVTGGEPLRG
ncbi:MAG TPA: biotin--[acetyl-CoA-carboxylase] ligase [Acidimicrobiales bacterium]|nr:biotin--[acetyl-CoA-carboxylase] ligase [Acidimicrobiales bacterium]